MEASKAIITKMPPLEAPAAAEPSAAARDIFIASGDSQQPRQLSLEQAKRFLDFGTLRHDEFAWCEGMEEWAPVSKVVQYLEGVDGSTEKSPGKYSMAALGEACFDLAMSFQESYARYVQELANAGEEESKLEVGRVWLELIYLGSFVVDHAIQSALPESKAKIVQKSYDEHLFRLKSGGTRMHRTIKNRLIFYAYEAKHSDSIHAAANVGRLFADYCGLKESRWLGNLGAKFFKKKVQFTTDWLSQVAGQLKNY